MSEEERANLVIAISEKIPLIEFFSLSENQQLAILPTIEDTRKYSFSDGDVVTSNSLAVLLNAYESSCLNSIGNNLLWMGVARDNSNASTLISELHRVVCTALKKAPDWWEQSTRSKDNIRAIPEMEYIRKLSRKIVKALNIQIQITESIMRACIDNHLHP